MSLPNRPPRIALALGALIGLAISALVAWLHPSAFQAPLDFPIMHGSGEDWDWQLTTWEATRVQLADGQLPTWCPWVSGGVPLLGNPESPGLSPLFLIVLAFGTVAGMKIVLLVQWWLLILGGWLAGREIGLSPISAHFASLALVASSFLPEFVGWGHQMFLGICWLPLAWVAQRRGHWALAGLLLAMPLLQGAHYIFFFGLVWLGLDALLRAMNPERVRWLAPGLLLNGLWLSHPTEGSWLVCLVVSGLLLLGLAAQRWRTAPDEPVDTLFPLLATLVVAGLLVGPKVLASGELVGVSPRLTNVLQQVQLNAPFTTSEAWGVLTGLLDRPAGHEGQNVFHHWFPVAGGMAGLALAAWRRPHWGVLGLLMWSLGWADATPVNFLEALNRLPGFNLLQKVERYSLVWTLFLGWGLGFGIDAVWKRSRWVAAVVAVVGTALWLQAALPHSRQDLTLGAPDPALYGLSVHQRETSQLSIEFAQGRGGDQTAFESLLMNRGRLDHSIAAPPETIPRSLRALHDEGYLGEAFEIGRRKAVQASVRGSEVIVRLDEPADVALNQTWYPGWTVDGQPTFSHDGLVAARLSRGEHRFRYSPRWLGAALLLHLLGWVLVGFATWRRRSRPQARPPSPHGRGFAVRGQRAVVSEISPPSLPSEAS